MPVEPFTLITRRRRLRADLTGGTVFDQSTQLAPSSTWIIPACLIAAAFAFLGAGNLDLNATEARLGLAAGEPIGPLGQVYGSFEPRLLFLRVLPAQLWAIAYGGAPTAAAVRWPAAIAAVLALLAVARGVAERLGARAALLFTAGCVATLAWLDRSDVGLGMLDALIGHFAYRLTGSTALLRQPIAPQVDFVTGLFVLAALGRLLNRGADLRAGLWTALAFLAGGWPAVAVVLLPTLILGRRESSPGLRWLWPTALASILWALWTASSARPEAVAAALAWPLTRPPAWTLLAWSIAYAMPLAPLAALVALSSIRNTWSDDTRAWLIRWAAAAGSLVLAGTLIPGLGDAARLPILVAIAIGFAATLETLINAWPDLPRRTIRLSLSATAVVVVPACLLGIPALGYLAAAVPYYRGIAIGLIGLIGVAGLSWLVAARTRSIRPLLASIILIGIAAKAAHLGMHVPEWNYRASQGPWGRAIGQWMPRASTLYFINPSAFEHQRKSLDRWPADLALAVGRRVRQLPAPAALGLEPSPGPHFLLLNPSEFDRWPTEAADIIRVRDLQDQFGQPRVLARTTGPLYPDRRADLGE